MSDLETLAEKGRQRRAERKTRGSSPEPTPRKPRQPKREERLRIRRAVTDAGFWGSRVAMIFGSLLAAALGASAAAALELPPNWVGLVGGGAGVATVALHFAVLNPLAFRWERRSLLRLPYRVGVDRYLRKLGKGRKRTKVEVVVHFRAPIAPQRRELFRRAADGLHPDARGKLKGDDTLTVTATLETYTERSPGSDTSRMDPYDNAPVHRFVRSVLRDGIATLHASHPVERVAVRLSSG
jgi:hypothetical protein